MLIEQFVFNPFGVNTYVVHDPSTNDAVIFDPANHTESEHNKLINYIKENNLKLHAILLTHQHVDHILGLRALVKTFNVPIYAHSGDQFLYENAAEHGSMFGLQVGDELPPITNIVNEGDTLTFGSLEFSTLHVPGHSPGSICYYEPSNGFTFVGDVLFSGSIGRTDLWGGNHDQLLEGIREKLFALPDQTKVHSGHGPTTTIGHEKETNPFLK